MYNIIKHRQTLLACQVVTCSSGAISRGSIQYSPCAHWRCCDCCCARGWRGRGRPSSPRGASPPSSTARGPPGEPSLVERQTQCSPIIGQAAHLRGQAGGHQHGGAASLLRRHQLLHPGQHNTIRYYELCRVNGHVSVMGS